MTARQTLIKFLEAWKKGDSFKMYKYCQITWKNNHNKSEIEKLFTQINEFSIVSGSEASVLCDFIVECDGYKRKFRVIKETGSNKPSENGIWGVNPISGLKVIK